MKTLPHHWQTTASNWLQTIDWSATIVNSAQVISAVATAGSVWVALWLARRSESQRLKFYVSERRLITVGLVPRTIAEVHGTHLNLTIVNAGVLPAHIELVMFNAQKTRSPNWFAILEPNASKEFPITLNHGENVSLSLPLTFDKFPNGNALQWFRWARRAYFDVRTTLGITKVKLTATDLRWIRRAMLRGRAVEQVAHD